MSAQGLPADVRWRSVELSGWGRHPVEACAVYRPERIDELAEIVAHAPQGTLIPRGLGRSYGDAALNGAGAVVLSERLDSMLAFDPAEGILTCEAAVSLAEILETFLPRGFFFPVTPGTKFVTIGGAIAADVHGKNHHRSGSMAESVLDFQLLTSRGEVLTCSRDQNADAFWATLGGMGLTGIVLQARLRLLRVPTAYMRVEYERAPDLDAALDRCIRTDEDYGYGVAWIDCLATGNSLGRSVLMRANHAACDELPEPARSQPLHQPRRIEPAVPFTLPNRTLNRASVKLFNEAYFRAQKDRHEVVDCSRYFYPLDSVRNWSRIYGRRGMIQYQLVLPTEAAREGLVSVLEAVSSSGCPCFLAVLKSFGDASGGLLSFPRPGFTLAMDLPHLGARVLDLVDKLDEIVLRHGGRVYLAKDSTLRPDRLAAMYPELARFREVKTRLDPANRFVSSQAQRLEICPAP